MKTNKELYSTVEEEFKTLPHIFDALEEKVIKDENLVTMHSKYNLYEIQPYYAQLANEVLDPNAKLIIESEEDFDPEIDDLYDYKVNLESRKTHAKTLHYGDGISYNTIFEYTEEYYKSLTVYKNNELINPVNVSILYFKDGLPHQFIECSDYGISLKTYTCENENIKSYKLEWLTADHHCIGELTYGLDGKLIKIVETASDERVRVLFDEDIANDNIETVLERLENFLVENIADQIIAKVRIDEPVYCILFEYTMQGPFPPTISFGLESEVEGEFKDNELYELYNAPDMMYFSENEGEESLLDIDFYPLEIQSNYLKTDAYEDTIPLDDDEASELWNKQVFDTYVRVCKRLMHYDFSASFEKSPNFLVMAKEFEQCNEEEFHEILSAYKKEKSL